MNGIVFLLFPKFIAIIVASNLNLWCLYLSKYLDLLLVYDKTLNYDLYSITYFYVTNTDFQL